MHKSFTVFFFEGEGCPHCAEEKAFLAALKTRYPDLRVLDYEVWSNKENARLLAAMTQALRLQTGGVPVTFVGDKGFFGFSGATKEAISQAIAVCAEQTCPNPLDIMKASSGEAPSLLNDILLPALALAAAVCVTCVIAFITRKT
ncbi:MAG TPA: hypothetical protein VK445_06985 [Dissulfurispiraceae bacterium]|nr:hypothetical protein [Dissulfurispiraceae bacterium]